MGTVMSALPESFASDAAERYWRSGNCVDVSILEGQSGDVQPGQELQIVGQPRHRIEGTALAKPVVASLSGSGAVDPTGVAVPAPAAFEYTAGQEGEIGTVTLTSTSDRGIGSTSATFRVPRTESPGPSGTPVPTPRPTPGPPTVVQGTIEYHFAMRSIADPGHTQDLTMELHVGLRSNDGPMADSTSVVMDGDNTFRATYREEVPCAGGHEEVRAGDGRGTLTLAAPPMTGDDKLVLSLDTSPFEITDEPCPGSPADPSHDSIGYMLTACAPDHDLLTGITRGLIGLGEGGDRLDGYSFDCSDVGGDESVKLTVTVTGFLAGSAPVPP
jgi:hypothetical protein